MKTVKRKASVASYIEPVYETQSITIRFPKVDVPRGKKLAKKLKVSFNKLVTMSLRRSLDEEV